jgi:hypothetical protein
MELFLLRGITKIPPAAPLQEMKKMVSGKRGILIDSAKCYNRNRNSTAGKAADVFEITPYEYSAAAIISAKEI